MITTKTSAMPPTISQRRPDPRRLASGAGAWAVPGAIAVSDDSVDAASGPSASVIDTLPGPNGPFPAPASPKIPSVSIAPATHEPCQHRDGQLGWTSGGSSQSGTPASAGAGAGPDRPDEPCPGDGGQPVAGSRAADAGGGRRNGRLLGRGGSLEQRQLRATRSAGSPRGAGTRARGAPGVDALHGKTGGDPRPWAQSLVSTPPTRRRAAGRRGGGDADGAARRDLGRGRRLPAGAGRRRNGPAGAAC